MNEDYYSPHPRTHLERPLAITGFAGAGVRAVAHGITAVTGLPLNDVERLVEARAGRSRTRLLFEDGRETLLRLEAEATGTALERRPPGVIALTDSALLDEALAERLTSEAQLVYVERPLPYLVERIREATPGSVPEFALAPPGGTEDLLATFRPREDGYLRADVHFQAGELHPQRIADELIEALRLLPSR